MGYDNEKVHLLNGNSVWTLIVLLQLELPEFR